MFRYQIESLAWGRWLVGVTRRMFLFGFILVLGLPAAASGVRGDCVGSTGGTVADASLFSGPTRGDDYREAVLRVKEKFHIPGVVAGVWVPGEKPWKIAEGKGDVERDVPISLDDYFPIRSITKSFTVTLILQLARMKSISLDDPIEKYVPGIPNGNEISLAQLAAMESGVKSYSDVEAFLSALSEDFGRPWSPEELVALALPQSPVFAPAADYDYSNTNTILLGMVVEKVTQKALAETYRERIFKPIRLRGTTYPNNTDIPSPHPTAYEVDPVTGELTKLPTVNLSAFGASGGMVSTLEDLHRWGKALGKGQLIGPRLQKIRLQHSRPATSGPEYDRYGLGIGELRGWWGHTGEGLGYQAATFYDPETGATISVLLNSSQRTNVATEVFKALADVIHPYGGETASSGAIATGRILYKRAKALDKKWEFTKAEELYKKAREAFLKEGESDLAQQCRDAVHRINMYRETYPYTETQLRDLLALSFPDVPEETREEWISSGTLEHITIDGTVRYLNVIVANIKYRNIDLYRKDPVLLAGTNEFVQTFLETVIAKPRPGPFVQYSDPKNYRAKGVLSIPRSELPGDGTLRVWFPLPLLTDPQQPVSVDSVMPTDYLKLPPAGGDISLAYMEVPLSELQGDLNASIALSFTHFEQHFSIDPSLVGSYDENDETYRKYTRSYGNTTITPDIRETARKVVGAEKNPYLVARKLYDYVVHSINYSLMPETLWPYGKPASVYVHENGFGDCGGQSMYFSALCRSIGIPARATGGKQMLAGTYQDHFWAEFFLPNYGWVPVDTSVGQLAEYVTNINDEQRREFEDFFFANQDNMRMVIQKDVDVPALPAVTGGMLYLPGAIQNPDGTCEAMEEIPGEFVQKHWRLQAE